MKLRTEALIQETDSTDAETKDLKNMENKVSIRKDSCNPRITHQRICRRALLVFSATCPSGAPGAAPCETPPDFTINAPPAWASGMALK